VKITREKKKKEKEKMNYEEKNKKTKEGGENRGRRGTFGLLNI
jgi:hypothetical protein